MIIVSYGGFFLQTTIDCAESQSHGEIFRGVVVLA